MLRIAHQAPLSYISFYYDVTDAPPNNLALSYVQSTDAPSIFLFSINVVCWIEDEIVLGVSWKRRAHLPRVFSERSVGQ